ncbi:MAG TPA: DUF4922 domain-containing protein, partial [Candidatus Omnitrophota bacterium]|nr:DUF4922 domain-containing protein [Candidatus Omnitrophota bacterium]
MNSGDTQSAWHALSAAWAQFDQIPGEEFVFADYAVRRHQFEELFLNWSKAVDPIYAYYLMAAFALRELNAFEGHVQNSGVINKRAVIKRIQTLHRKIQNIQRIVLTVLTAERHSKIDPKEMDAALGSIARAVKEAWSASEKTVETVYSNDRKKVFSGSKFNDPQLPLTSSFYRLVAEMKVYSDSLPKGARLAGPSKTIEVIFDQMLRTAERVRSTDVPEERKRAAVEFLDSMPFKITIDVHAEIERFLGEEGRSINDYQKALDTIQTVFSGMEPAERSRLLDLVVKAAQSTRGNLIVGLARPLRARFSDLRLPKGARLSQQTLVSVKDLRGNLSFIQELLKIKRKEEASARQQTSDILDRVLPRFLLWTVSGTVMAGLVASGGDHSSLATGVFTAGFSIGALQVLLPLRPSETKRRILREEISSLAAEEHSLKARIYEFFTAEPDRDYSKLIQRSLTRVEEIANVDRQNPDRPHLTDRVKRLIVQVIRFERQVEAGYPFWSSAAQKAAIDRSYEEVIRKLGSILLDSAEYIEGDGQDTDLAARIEVFGVAGAGESINDFFRAVQGELPLPEDRAGARLASLNQLTGGILTQAFYAARILNLKKALDSLWSDHEATGFIRRTPAESDIRKSVGPFIIGQIDMSEKFRGTIRQIGPEDLEEFSRTFGLATPAYVLRSMIRGIVNRVSPPLTKKCPLCEANFPLTESALRWKGHLRWNITPNPFPILNAPEDRHFVVAAVDHTPQVLDQKAIEDMVALAREAKDHRILFNGIGAGSSVPSHRHIQMVTYPFPIENEYYFPLQTVKRDGEVFTYRVNHYPRELYAFQSSNASALARTIHEKIAVLQLRQIPYDLLFVRQDYGPVRAYLFALNPKRRYGFSGVHQSSGYIFAPAQNAAGEPVGLYDELNPDSYPGSPEEREDRALEAIKGYLKDTLHPIEMWELLEVPIEGARLATAQEQPLRETSVRVERPGKDAIKVVIRKKVDPSSIQSDAVELELSLDSDEADAVRFTIERPMNESPDTLASLVQRYIRENDIVLEASISPESEEAVRLALSTELDMIEDLYTIQRDPRGVNYDQVKYFVDEFYRMLEKRIFHNHSPSGEQEKAIRKELREILEESIKNAFESIQVRFMHEDDTALKDVPEEKRPLQEGEIHVMLVPEGDRLMFRIVDDGMGVHPEVLRLTERESKNREEDEKDWLSGWMERWEKYYQSSIKHNHPEQFLELSGQGKGLMMIEHFSHDKMIQGTWTLKDRSRELKDKTGAIFTYHFNFNGKVAKKNGGARLAKAGDYKAALDKITTSFSEGIDSFLKNPSLTEVSLQSILQYENQKITDLVPSAQRGAARK